MRGKEMACTVTSTWRTKWGCTMKQFCCCILTVSRRRESCVLCDLVSRRDIYLGKIRAEENNFSLLSQLSVSAINFHKLAVRGERPEGLWISILYSIRARILKIDSVTTSFVFWILEHKFPPCCKVAMRRRILVRPKVGQLWTCKLFRHSNHY